MEKFFVSCLIGFEKILWAELQEVWPFLRDTSGQIHSQSLPEAEFALGGIEIQCELILGAQLVFHLKTANRVLWRRMEFRSRDFPDFFAKVSKFNFTSELFCLPSEVNVQSTKSRLGQEKRIEETFLQALAKQKLASANSQQAGVVYIRIHDDQVQISFDLCGEHLHKRGYATKKLEAPIRETLAATCLRVMTQDVPISELGEVTLLDPCCGSGTMLFEAMTLNSLVSTREFLFSRYKKIPKILLSMSFLANFKEDFFYRSVFKKGLGYDGSEQAIAVAKQNLAEFSKAHKASIEFETRTLKASVADLDFDLGQQDKPVWVIINPPYGERLQTRELDFIQAAAQLYRPERIAAVQPSSRFPKELKGYSLLHSLSFKNGGLDVQFRVYQITK